MHPQGLCHSSQSTQNSQLRSKHGQQLCKQLGLDAQPATRAALPISTARPDPLRSHGGAAAPHCNQRAARGAGGKAQPDGKGRRAEWGERATLGVRTARWRGIHQRDPAQPAPRSAFPPRRALRLHLFLSRPAGCAAFSALPLSACNNKSSPVHKTDPVSLAVGAGCQERARPARCLR